MPGRVDISHDTPERDHQAVEISIRDSIGACIHAHDLKVDFMRSQQLGWKHKRCQPAPEIKAGRDPRGIRILFPVIIAEFILLRPGSPRLEFIRSNDLFNLVGGISAGIHPANHSPDGCADDIVDWNVVLFQRPEHADMGSAFSTSATENDSDLLGAERSSEGLNFIQGLGKVGNDLIRLFNAHRQPHQLVGDAALFPGSR